MSITRTAVTKVSGWPAAVEVFVANQLKNLRRGAETRVKRDWCR